MRTIKLITPVIILAIGIGSFAYFKSTREKPEPLQARSRAPMISVESVQKISAAPMTRLFGTVETPSFGLLTSAIEADVLKVNVLEGDSVTRGQEIILLDDADIKLEVLQRGAELSEIEALIENDKIRLKTDRESLQAEKELLSLIRRSVERAKTLAKTRAASEATLDEALQNEQRQLLAIIQRQKSIDEFPARQLQLEARRQKAEATRKKAERDLARTRIEAPFSGRIAQVMVSEGNRVSRGGQLVNLYDESRLELRIQVPLSFVPGLKEAIDSNQAITAITDVDGKQVDLTFHRLSSLIEKGQGGVDAFFRSDSRLPALGTTLGIWVNLPERQDVVQVSPDALYDRNRVYVVKNNVLESRQVDSVGERVDENGRSLVLLDGSAFEEGELVMNSRLPQAVSGLAVEFTR